MIARVTTPSLSVDTHGDIIETASVFSQSHTVSIRVSSWRKLARGRGASGGEIRAKDLVINIDADFPARVWCSKVQFKAKVPATRTGAVDRGIWDTHLQRGLKNHPSAPVQKGEVCCIFSWSFKFLLYACANKLFLISNAEGCQAPWSRCLVHFSPTGVCS